MQMSGQFQDLTSPNKQTTKKPTTKKKKKKLEQGVLISQKYLYTYTTLEFDFWDY